MSERICAMIVTGDDAVSKVRKINGKTNPLEAEIGSIRGMYGESIDHNIVHSSDSSISAIREINIWFPKNTSIIESDNTLSKIREYSHV
jgi:nucleoside-diphosphate kinase